MKKIIASVLLACFGASILIAEVPVAVAASSDPFAGVEGVELTAVEEGEVEGEGVGGALLGAFGGAIGGAIGETLRTTVRTVTKTENRTSKQIASDICTAAKYSAIVSGIWGAITTGPL